MERIIDIMPKKYYAVRKGNNPGIYTSWEECKKQVHGFKGAEYKSFVTEDEAHAYIHPQDEINADCTGQAVAYVDGSYNAATKAYGFGLHLEYEGKVYEKSGRGDNEEKASMRNVAGEIDGAMQAVAMAKSLGARSLVIYYDYMGIEQWASGGWKANKEWTKEYAAYMKNAMTDLDIIFCKVMAHTGVEGNERVDVLAKKAVGIL